MLHDVASMVEIRSGFERVRGVKRFGESRFSRYIFRQEAEWVPSGNGDSRAEKPQYDVPQRVAVKIRYKADLANQLRRSRSKTYVYAAVLHASAEWLRFTDFCRLPK